MEERWSLVFQISCLVFQLFLLYFFLNFEAQSLSALVISWLYMSTLGCSRPDLYPLSKKAVLGTIGTKDIPATSVASKSTKSSKSPRTPCQNRKYVFLLPDWLQFTKSAECQFQSSTYTHMFYGKAFVLENTINGKNCLRTMRNNTSPIYWF